ncbi:ASCH domain-containing protein [Ornithinicoccus hortensis]|uniref:Uncharacterized protein YhfF n=1 Tax=Ornithinicoccus hortensis TaxID=82346 RepID=A0A542YV22_9MICO|nr:ASCH domain-containing protein [Ornithinicoccus hortensis]TQL51936.1 uncharacterized protein YhfF [Ornithinicoccus hortensis]
MNEEQIAAFWADARIRGGLNPAQAYVGAGIPDTVPPPAWSFGDDPAQADELLALVLAGRKTATASAYWDYREPALSAREDEGGGEGAVAVATRTDLDAVLPEPGLLSIILDGAGTPRALVRTTDVAVVPFREVGAEHARREGEGDGSLEHWRATHRAFFAANAPEGETFHEDMLVVLERFVVLVPASARRAAKRHGL